MLSQSLTVLDIDEQTAGAATTLGALAAGKPLVVDFWHTRCVRCPEALSKLDGIAPKHPGVTFVACALSLGADAVEGTQEQVLELLEGQWENLTHAYLTFDEKEAAKAAFGFKAVPFCAVFGADGDLKYSGEPKGVDWATVFDAAPAQEQEQQLADELAAKASVADKKAGAAADAPPAAPLGEATNRQAASLGFGNDDEDF